MLNKNIPFYMQIARILRSGILDGKYPPGSKFPNEDILAAEFGVSKDVIRKSMRIIAEEGLVKRIRRNGTFVADIPQSRGAHILLLSCHGPLPLSKICRGITAGLGNRQYDLVLKMIHPIYTEVERNYLAQINPANYAAIVTVPAVELDNSDNREIYAQYIRSGIPVIAVDHEYTDIPADCVCFDEYASVRKMIEDTISRCEPDSRIAFMGVDVPHRIPNARTRALRDFFMEMGGESKNRRLFTVRQTTLDNNYLTDTFLAQLNESGFNPDTIIITHNLLGYELFDKLRRQGRHLGIRRFGVIGDPGIGDEEFGQLAICHYRLFDGFVEPIKDILEQRLYHPESLGTTIVRRIMFKPMLPAEVKDYLASAYRPDTGIYTG